MENLHHLETVILLMAVVIALTAFARKALVPYPILLVIGGLVLGSLPGLPVIRLDPDLVFLVFLPPILWAAAYFTSLRDFRANLRPISLLAIGLVLTTTAIVAIVARTVMPGIGWAEAVTLGAIVSPPDAVAATAIGRRLRIPYRVVTILEGESLVNDATALVLYRAAIGAAVSGTFVLSHVFAQFFLAAAIGIVIGLAVGLVNRLALQYIDDSFSEVALSLLAPYVAWVLAERAHASSVLACVAGGIYLRQYFSAIVAPITRLQARAVWDVLIFLLNGFIFILIGLQLGPLRAAVPHGEFGALIWHGVLLSLTVIGVRLVWVPVAAYLPRRLSPALRARDPVPPWPVLFLIAWVAMRGIVSLAAALALPLTTASGAAFPFRNEIILLTFAVILFTLVLQGLSLAPLIHALHLRDDHALEYEEARAREHAAISALARLEELAAEGWPPPEDLDQLRTYYTQRARRFAQPMPNDPNASSQATAVLRRLRHETLTAERRAVISLRNAGIVSDEVLFRIEQELDVEAMRVGVGELRAPLPADLCYAAAESSERNS
jgi:CPA1 family monovalent cation:H+ antiporter